MELWDWIFGGFLSVTESMAVSQYALRAQSHGKSISNKAIKKAFRANKGIFPLAPNPEDHKELKQTHPDRSPDFPC
jgi:hypothetical protein